MNGFFNEALLRLQRIDVEPYIVNLHKRYHEFRTDAEYEADAQLIAEYYRRVGVLLQELSIEGVGIWGGMAQVAKRDNSQLLDYEQLPSLCPNLGRVELLLIKLISFHYLNWCILLDNDDPVATRHKDIYEPMIRLFERGGGMISTHHHELVGGFGAFSRSILASRGDMREFDISDAALARAGAEVEYAQDFVEDFKRGCAADRRCLRCGGKLNITEKSDYTVWYKVSCETPQCFNRNFS